jgi:hypothetical protein
MARLKVNRAPSAGADGICNAATLCVVTPVGGDERKEKKTSVDLMGIHENVTIGERLCRDRLAERQFTNKRRKKPHKTWSRYKTQSSALAGALRHA